jgi:hypothetical protein
LRDKTDKGILTVSLLMIDDIEDALLLREKLSGKLTEVNIHDVLEVKRRSDVNGATGVQERGHSTADREQQLQQSCSFKVWLDHIFVVEDCYFAPVHVSVRCFGKDYSPQNARK